MSEQNKRSYDDFSALIGDCLPLIGIFCQLACGVVGALALLVIVFGGFRWFAQHYYVWVVAALSLLLIVLIPFGLFLCLFRKSRPIGGIGLFVSAYLLLLWTWLWSLIATASLAGFGWLIGGLFFGGLGTIPVALVALLLNRQWVGVGQMLLMLFGAWVLYIVGVAITFTWIERSLTQAQVTDYV